MGDVAVGDVALGDVAVGDVAVDDVAVDDVAGVCAQCFESSEIYSCGLESRRRKH